MTDALTVAEARRRGQGSAHLDADPTYARWIVRRVSPYISWFLVRFTPLSADAVTSLSIGSGIAGGLLVAAGTAGTDLLAVVLLQLAYLFDVADGEVARIRGTAGKRGTYLDLIGHFLQNRALYAGAALSLVAVTGAATWAILVGLAAMGLSAPFGLYAYQHVTAARSAEHPDHAPRAIVGRPAGSSPAGWVRWAYRRVAFLWNYPASMNLFCAALLADAVRMLAGWDRGPLAVPIVFVAFGASLAAKQVAHALRLLGAPFWR